MIALQLPSSHDEIAAFAQHRSIPMESARARFRQYCVLLAIGGSRTLREVMVFKGGGALDDVWLPNRSTRDLDFTCADGDHDLGFWQLHITRRLGEVDRKMGTCSRIQSAHKQPGRQGTTRHTWNINIAVALRDESSARDRIRAGRDVTNPIEVEIAANDVVCQWAAVSCEGGGHLRVCTLDDIVAEKLRALLQQVSSQRGRNRPQDLLDIAVVLRSGRDIDTAAISRFLAEKGKARDVVITKAAFANPEVLSRALVGYDELRANCADWIESAPAWQEVARLAANLDIPEMEANP